MDSIPFYKINPSGNMTCLFDALYLDKAEKLFIGEKALSAGHLACEQVGFVDVNKGILEMAGGEFCLNATRSLALLMALNDEKKPLKNIFLNENDAWSGKVLTSGIAEALKVKVYNLHSIAHYTGEVCDNVNGHMVEIFLPIPIMPSMQKLAEGVVLVNMQGISHLLLDANIHPFAKEHWQNQATDLRNKFNLNDLPAVGCIWWRQFDLKQVEAIENIHCDICGLEIDPVVYVKNPLSEHYESACGSGTLAVALWMYTQKGQLSFYAKQPGGFLNINFTSELHLSDEQQCHEGNSNEISLIASIGGPIHIVAKGEAFF